MYVEFFDIESAAKAVQSGEVSMDGTVVQVRCHMIYVIVCKRTMHAQVKASNKTRSTDKNHVCSLMGLWLAVLS